MHYYDDREFRHYVILGFNLVLLLLAVIAVELALIANHMGVLS